MNWLSYIVSQSVMESILFGASSFIFISTVGLTAWSVISRRKLKKLIPRHSFNENLPAISIIIPARNEEEDIAESLDSRITVLNNPALNEGWLGKANAMQAGTARAKNDYLIFTDADIIHSETCFASALQTSLDNQYDFFSFSPLWLNKTLSENINLPMYFMGFLKLMSIPEIDDPVSQNALASGAFMLLKRTIFNDENGFECVKDNMFDDVGFAEHLKSKNYRVSYWLGPECSKVRLFKNTKDAFWGTTKNILSAVDGKVIFAFPLILLGIFQYWTPLFCLLWVLMSGSDRLILLGCVTYISQYLSFFSIRSLFTFHPLKLLAFPMVVIVSSCCIVRAAWYMRNGIISWRGRKIKVS